VNAEIDALYSECCTGSCFETVRVRVRVRVRARIIVRVRAKD
jgi:hypothetical protein